MDFNINNETFANAYKCLNDANILLQNGLGDFSVLDGSALSLVGKSGISNTDRLNNSNKHCSELQDKMYRTIDSLSAIDIESAHYFNDILGDVSLINDDWDGTRLTAPMGINRNGPLASETWYDLNMSGVVKNMEKLYGYSDLEYNVRGDGVKVLSGVTPDGERFENLVMVAADVEHISNPNGTFKRGEIVQTSLGMGIVVDACGRSISERKSTGNVHFDIATAWHTGEYMAAVYSKEPYLVSNEHFEQVVPGQSVKSVDNYSNVDTDVNTSVTLEAPFFIDSNLKNDVTVCNENLGINNGYNSNVQSKNNTLIAHRGYSPGGITDNSRESFTMAGESGYWGCEADVRFDSDGNLVCSHNSVKGDENPILFDEYLDICKEYGMTPVIDIKYENGTEVLDPSLSPAILQTLKDKGMLDTSILQTNNTKDVAYIRQNSEDARIWLLKDAISDNDIQLIHDNGVECVNIKSSEDKNLYRIKNLADNGVDVCVWNVQSEQYKNALINNGAKYVMTDYAFDVSPYQEGDVDFNNIQNI